MSAPVILGKPHQYGYTLVELMVAMTIGLVILAALGTVYLGTTRTTRQSDMVSRMSEDAAIAFNYIGSYIRMAGYSMPAVRTLPGGALINNVIVVEPDRNFTGAGVRGCDNGFADVTQAFDDADDKPTCASTAGPAAIAVRFEGDHNNTIPVTGSGGGGGSVTLPSDCLNQGVAATDTSALGGNYSLIDSRFLGKIGASSGSPDLYCAGKGDGFASPQPLLQSVEDIQFTYGIAEDASGREVKFYTDAAGVDALAGTINERWARVITVRVCLLMRSEARNQADTDNYIDCAGDYKSADDGRMRRAFTSVYGLRNRSGFLTPS